MWFGEPHPVRKRESPTRLSTSGQQSYKGWSCRVFILGRNVQLSITNGCAELYVKWRGYVVSNGLDSG